MVRERMERDSMVGGNDKIDLKNKLNVGECRESQSDMIDVGSTNE
jgi:hypothetical protein